jgi:aspartyl protease family protein
MIVKVFSAAIAVGLLVGILAPSNRPASGGEQSLILTPQTKAPVSSKPVHGFETILPRHADGHFYADVTVDGRVIHFLVDTGASAIALTKEDASALGIALNPSELEIVGRGASGEVRGKFITLHHVQIDNKEAWDLHGAVLAEGLGVSLLGQNFLSQVGTVEIKGDRMILR